MLISLDVIVIPPDGEQLSVAVAVPVPVGVELSSQLIIRSDGHVNTGAVLSIIVIICTKVELTFPQSSVTVQVFV